uniref:Elongator complex protein 5 n=1 Tax=Rhabditophanes sp. KR3021 TaxID=114890 RepID=A0AC35TMG0_9BILA
MTLLKLIRKAFNRSCLTDNQPEKYVKFTTLNFLKYGKEWLEEMENKCVVIFDFYAFVHCYSPKEWKKVIAMISQRNKVVIIADYPEEGGRPINDVQAKLNAEYFRLPLISDQVIKPMDDYDDQAFHCKRISVASNKVYKTDYLTFTKFGVNRVVNVSKESPIVKEEEKKVEVQESPDVRNTQVMAAQTDSVKQLPFMLQQNTGNSKTVVEMSSSSTVRAGGRIIFQDDDAMDDEDDDLDI